MCAKYRQHGNSGAIELQKRKFATNKIIGQTKES
jgi:hypothetical protein